MPLARLLVRRRRLVWLAILLLTAGLGTAGLRLHFDFSPQALYAADDDVLAFSEEVKARFGYPDALLAVVLEAPRGEDVLTPDRLAWLRDVTRRAAVLEGVETAESIATLAGPRLGPGARPTLEPLLADGPPTEASVARLRAILDRLAEVLDANLVSRDRRVAAVLVRIDPARLDVRSMQTVLDRVEEVLAATPTPTGCRLHMAGLPEIRTAVIHDIHDDQRRMIPMAAAMFALVMLLVYRGVAGSVLPVLAVILGVVWTAGVLELTGQSLNIVSNILPTLLFIIGTANSVHVVNRYAEECHRTPQDRAAALVRTLRHMGPACLLTFLTTAIGFMSLATARFRVLQEVAWQTAIGLACLYVSTMLVLGASLSRFPPPRHAAAGTAGPGLGRWLGRLGERVARHPRLVLGLGLLVAAAALFGARMVVVNSRLLETYEEGHPMTETLRVVEDELGGVLTVDVDLRTDTPGGLLDPEVWARVRRFEVATRARPEVLSVLSFVELQRAVGAWLRPGEPPPEAPDAAQIAQWHAVTEAVASGLDLRRFLAPGASEARIRIGVRDVGSRRLLVLCQELEADLARLRLADDGVRARLAGDGYVYAHSMDGFIRDLVRSLLGAAVVIFGVIAVLFRSPRLGMISIIPNVTPLVVTLGYLGLRGYELNGSIAVVFAVGLGIAVDDTIHYLARFREEAGAGEALGPTIGAAMRGAGRAMVLTTGLMILGLSFLMTSEFVVTRRFAELTSVTMAAALLGDLALLPACLVLFGGRRLLRPGAGRALS